MRESCASGSDDDKVLPCDDVATDALWLLRLMYFVASCMFVAQDGYDVSYDVMTKPMNYDISDPQVQLCIMINPQCREQ